MYTFAVGSTRVSIAAVAGKAVSGATRYGR